ncbi:mechanosensitive ion channel family protein [Rhodobacteraceae bacterium NNCM2]|nr:mechanosensitive ion channel family protein [Coraliihabitans acroporae]
MTGGGATPGRGGLSRKETVALKNLFCWAKGRGTETNLAGQRFLRSSSLYSREIFVTQSRPLLHLFESFRLPLFLLVTLLLAFTAIPAGAQDAQDAEDPSASLSAEVKNPNIDPTELGYRLVPLTKEELGALSVEWLNFVKAKTEEVMEAQIEISKAADGAASDARERYAELVNERKALFQKFARVVGAWEAKGGDEAAVADYRAYQDAIVVENARTADAETLAKVALAWAMDPDGGIALAIQIGIIIVSLIALVFVARIVRRFIRRWIGHVPNLSKLLQAFLVTLVYWIVLAVGLMVVLSALGVDVTPVFALIGGASFIMAFAFQDTLGNLASGLMIMINRPFDEGDYVDIGGVAGTVKSVSIVATTVTTPDNQVIVIPNKNVWGNVITNVTASATRRVDLVFGIAYEDSIPDAMRVMEETVAAHPLVLAEPAPVIRVNELADSSVNFICRPWAKTSDYWTLYWDLMRQVKENFDAAGISIPYPQQDVHVKSGAPSAPSHPAAPSTPSSPDMDFAKADGND